MERRDKKIKKGNGTRKISAPPSWTWVLAFSTAFTAIALSVAALSQGQGGTPLAVFFYVLSVLSVFCCAFFIVRSVKKLREEVSKVTDRYAFTRNIKSDYEFRALVFSVAAFICNIGYTVFLFVMAMNTGTLWYFALAVYYILLTSARGGVMMRKRKLERRFGGNTQRLYREKLRTYQFCAVMLLALTVALFVAVVQMSFEGKRLYKLDGGFVVFAVFAAYRVVLSVQNFIKGKSNDLTIRAVDNLNFATALVTLLSMQTAFLDALATPLAAGICNGVTGVAVCAAIVAVGAYMWKFVEREGEKNIPAEKQENSENTQKTP